MEIFGHSYTVVGGKFFSLPVTSTEVYPRLDPNGELLGRAAVLLGPTAGPLGTAAGSLDTTAGPVGPLLGH